MILRIILEYWIEYCMSYVHDISILGHLKWPIFYQLVPWGGGAEGSLVSGLLMHDRSLFI